VSPSDIALLSDDEIVELVVDLSQDRTIGTLAGEEVYSAILELRKRHVPELDVPRTPSGRVRRATSIEIDPERWRSAWFRRRLTQLAVCELIGKSYTFINVCARRGSVSYYTLDAIAAQLGEVTDDLAYEVGSDRERQRLAFA
jgi:hypothetical protein